MSAIPGRSGRSGAVALVLTLLGLTAAPLVAQQGASIFTLLDARGRTLAPGQEASGQLAEGDYIAGGLRVQAWTLEGQPGRALEIDMLSDTLDPFLIVAGPGLDDPADDDSGEGTNARLCVEIPEAGRYVVVAGALDRETGPYTLRAEERDACPASGSVPVGSDQLLDVPAAGSLAVGSAVTDTLTRDTHFGEQPAQRWTIQGREGQRLAIQQSSDSLDSYLYFGGPGFPLPLQNDDVDGTLNARLCVTLPETGTYQVLATGLGADDVGAYRLSVTADPDGEICDDFLVSLQSGLAQAPLEGTALEPGSEVTGTLDPATDQRHPQDGSLIDVYGLDAEAGEHLVVDLISDQFDAYMYVTGPGIDDSLIDDDSGGRCNARIELTAAETGTYRVVVNSVSETGEGAYTLRVSREAGPVAEGECEAAEVPGEVAEALAAVLDGIEPEPGRELAVGTEVTGRLTAADPMIQDSSYIQAWALPATAGETVVVELLSDDFDAYLYLTGPGFDQVLFDDDGAPGTNARITFTPPVDGTYRVLVNSYAGAATGEFRLRALRHVEP